MVLVTSLQQVTTADRCPSSWISWGHRCYRYKMFKSLLLALLAVCACAYEAKDVDVSLGKEDQPRGVKFARADEPGISLVAYHYSVNKVVNGVNAGDYNVDVTEATDGYWVHEDASLNVNYGDTIYYWVNVIKDGSGYNKIGQSWTASAPATTTQATTTTVTPTTATTQAPTVTTIRSTTTSATTTQGSPGVTATPPQSGSLIFEDTFDTFDLDTWQHEITAGGGGNGEFQYYTNNRSNSYVREKVLYIKPTLTSAKESEEFLTCGTLNLWGSTPADLCTGHKVSGCERSGSATNYINPIQSARIRTVESFAFKYGKIEVEAQMPKGDWIWPAIWLMPKRDAYGQWPASGEIDLVEVRGNEDLTNSSGTYVGVQQMGQTLHWGPFSPINGAPKTHVTKNLPDGGKFSDAFYKFGLEWTADSLKFYLDNEETMTVDPGDSGFWDYGGFGDFNCSFDNPWANSPNKLAPFDQEFYIIINVAVGGTGYFSDWLTNRPYPKPWLNNSTHPIKDFYDAKCDWYPTWNAHVDNGEDAALKVRSVRVWAV